MEAEDKKEEMIFSLHILNYRVFMTKPKRDEKKEID